MNRLISICATVGALAIGTAHAVDIDGNRNLPPCNPFGSLKGDCHITDRDMAINMMGNPPSRERQPNAYAEYMQYEHDRARMGMHAKDLPHR